MGYFAVLYKRMTMAVLEGIDSNRFENAERMRRLDTNFANRYLKSMACLRWKKSLHPLLEKTFDACGNDKLTVIQHLLLGINTHINLDLELQPQKPVRERPFMILKKIFRRLTRSSPHFPNRYRRVSLMSGFH
jgi:hypothetical protein